MAPLVWHLIYVYCNVFFWWFVIHIKVLGGFRRFDVLCCASLCVCLASFDKVYTCMMCALTFCGRWSFLSAQGLPHIPGPC